jgi:hypothetical protein
MDKDMIARIGSRRKPSLPYMFRIKPLIELANEKQKSN